jgi:competence protein ComEA
MNRIRLLSVVALVAVFSLMASGLAMAAAADQAVKGAAGAATESAKDTAKGSTFKATKAALAPGQKVNINKAKADELAKLPGVGSKIAADIVAYREKNGLFKTTEDLKKVKGIGEKKFGSLKDKITIE